MDASHLLRRARNEAGLTLRQLGERAGTSHSTLAAYESGRKTPNVTTLERVLRAAGFAADIQLHKRQTSSPSMQRGDELVAVLELAAEFPARHADVLAAPIFGRVVS
jgi:transcriptional regulator with XRE-family HTH domain